MQQTKRDISDSYIDREGLLRNGPFRVVALCEYMGYVGFITSSEAAREEA